MLPKDSTEHCCFSFNLAKTFISLFCPSTTGKSVNLIQNITPKLVQLFFLSVFLFVRFTLIVLV